MTDVNGNIEFSDIKYYYIRADETYRYRDWFDEIRIVLTTDIVNWLKINVRNNWGWTRLTKIQCIYFKNKEDMIAFTMVWL